MVRDAPVTGISRHAPVTQSDGAGRHADKHKNRTNDDVGHLPSNDRQHFIVQTNTPTIPHHSKGRILLLSAEFHARSPAAPLLVERCLVGTAKERFTPELQE
jgi:hypothetical protein